MYYRLEHSRIISFGMPFYASSVPLKAENVTSGYVITRVQDGRLERFKRLVCSPDGIQQESGAKRNVHTPFRSHLYVIYFT